MGRAVAAVDYSDNERSSWPHNLRRHQAMDRQCTQGYQLYIHWLVAKLLIDALHEGALIAIAIDYLPVQHRDVLAFIHGYQLRVHRPERLSLRGKLRLCLTVGAMALLRQHYCMNLLVLWHIYSLTACVWWSK